MRKQYTSVATAAGPYQSRAKVRLLDPPLGGAAAAGAVAPAGVCARAKAALDRMLAAEAEQKAAQGTVAASDPDAQRQWQQQVAAARNEAMKCCREGLEGRAAVSGEQRNTLRYYLAFLHYEAGQFEEAATEGEAMLDSAELSPAARQAVRTALAAREALFHGAEYICARGRRRSSCCANGCAAQAEKIVRRAGAYPESDDARAVLTESALADNRLDVADDYLRQISERDRRLGEAELGVGQALWTRAQLLVRCSTIDHDHSAEAEKLSARAADLLADGIARCRGGRGAGLNLNDAAIPAKAATTNDQPALANGILALAEIEMFRGRAAEAASLLADGRAGRVGSASSLKLLANIAAGESDKARASLHALLAPLPPQDGGESGRQTVVNCINLQRLVARYVGGYRERRLDGVLKHTVEQVDAFLAMPADGSAASLFMLVFRAEALAGLAAGLDSGGPAVPSDAQLHYRRAIAEFQAALRSAETQRNSPQEVVLTLRIDMARCLRRLSDNEAALNLLRSVLKDHPRMVDAQLEAAYTCQSWGDERPEYFATAIQGDRSKDVWGWGEFARRVQPEARFRELFFEARYNLAFCRFRQAQNMETPRRPFPHGRRRRRRHSRHAPDRPRLGRPAMV